MTQTILRFVLGGTLIAFLPIISRQFGPSIAGVALLFPAVSLVGLYVIGHAEGAAAMGAAAGASVVGVPTVLAFLLGVRFSAGAGFPVLSSLAVGVAAWFVAAVPTVWLVSGGLGSHAAYAADVVLKAGQES